MGGGQRHAQRSSQRNVEAERERSEVRMTTNKNTQRQKANRRFLDDDARLAVERSVPISESGWQRLVAHELGVTVPFAHEHLIGALGALSGTRLGVRLPWLDWCATCTTCPWTHCLDACCAAMPVQCFLQRNTQDKSPAKKGTKANKGLYGRPCPWRATQRQRSFQPDLPCHADPYC